MEFTNQFTVNAPLQTVWNFMLDAQQVTPCVPGAQITEVIDEAHYKGTVKIKLGAVQMTYRGQLTLAANEADRTIVLNAKGTEARGSGGASGTITSRLIEHDGTTEVNIVSQVDVTGRVAQFGRGIMQDVANRLIRQFAECLEQKLQGDSGPAEAAVAPSAAAEQSPPGSAVATAPAAVEPRTTTPTPSAAAPPASTSSALSIQELLMDVVRSRIARWLRDLARQIEPK